MCVCVCYATDLIMDISINIVMIPLIIIIMCTTVCVWLEHIRIAVLILMRLVDGSSVFLVLHLKPFVGERKLQKKMALS